MPDEPYNLTLEGEQWTLVLSDQGVAVPAAHAASHAAAGSDPITIANTQVTGLGTMSTQAATNVAITGGSIDGSSIGQSAPEVGSFTDLDCTAFNFGSGSIGTLTLTTDLAVAHGGTGASSAPAARSNLGLTDLATQLPSAVNITGGSITGITDLDVADGGTGVSTLTGIVRGSGTSAFTAVTSSTAGQVLRCTGANTFAFGAVDLTNSSAVTGALPVTNGGTGATSTANARTALDVPATNNTVRWRSDITDYTGGSANDLDSIDISDTGVWPTGATLAFSVGGALVQYRITASGAAESSPTIIRPDSYGGREWTLISYLASSVAITGGTITGITDLAVADGGTGASTLTGVLIGNGTSAFTASTSSTAGQVLRCTGANTFTFGALDLADADAVTGALPVANGGTGGTTTSTAQTGIGLVSGSDTLNGTVGVTVALTGATSSSNIVACHRGSGFGTAGALRVEPGTDQIIVYSTEASDLNDFTYFGTL